MRLKRIAGRMRVLPDPTEFPPKDTAPAPKRKKASKKTAPKKRAPKASKAPKRRKSPSKKAPAPKRKKASKKTTARGTRTATHHEGAPRRITGGGVLRALHELGGKAKVRDVIHRAETNQAIEAIEDLQRRNLVSFAEMAKSGNAADHVLVMEDR